MSLALISVLTLTMLVGGCSISQSKVSRSITGDRAVLENAVIRGEWKLDDGRMTSLTVENKHTGQMVTIGSGHLPQVVLSSGRTIDLAFSRLVKTLRLEKNSIVSAFKDKGLGLTMRWSATLDDGANAIIQNLQLTASHDTKIKELVFIDATLEDARQVGQVDGSVVVYGDIFMAVEHPLAKNTVGEKSHVRCALPRGNVLKAGQSWTHTNVIGVAEPGQLRRGFLYYLERRRAHRYRPFLHYNNWYDVILARSVERIRESECFEAIEIYGRELVEKRGVKMDAFVWDDGWDDFNSLWGFHKGFPDGFKNLNTAASKYGAAQGVWMSPWGGYATAKDKRIAYGKSQGYETNASGFSMAGAKYQKAFRDVCLNMMRENGVIFFKFDGMGGGGSEVSGAAEMADDIDAVLELTRTLRRENPDVFISATVGTWASPFWTLYADSIWRQGGDNGFYGKGDTRQQWITYRDKYCYERIVQLGPLYPLNSLMLHGILIGDRRSPARIVRNEKSIADEIWSFFGSGTNLQELYINPKLPTERTWDDLAAAAKWSRLNSDVLVDTHWIGGNPGKEQVYGWASWRPGKGILVLRNPSDKPQQFSITTKEALELPEGVKDKMTLNAVYPQDRKLTAGVLGIDQPINLNLQPFEVVVIELAKAKGECALLPEPQQISYDEGVCQLAPGSYVWVDKSSGDNLVPIAEDIIESLGSIYGDLKLSASNLNNTSVAIRVAPQRVSQAQGYQLLVLPEKIQIIAHDRAGAFYAGQTLKQICRVADGKLKCMEVNDWPDYPNRGVMLDISRDKVPTMKTIYQLIDTLAEFKINQFQLYTEHTFAYRNHKIVWKDASPMTARQIQKLDRYCAERYIELVPNQNSFGHMNRWLKHERYSHLAETPGGSDLSPVIPGSIELLRDMYDDLLPNFSSSQFNVGCDETWSLGKGKSKAAVEEDGVGKVYLDFLKQIHGLVSSHGRTMQFWGDIVMNHPELVSELPDGIIVMEWGYRAKHPYDEHCKKYADAGVPFYVCPGTSTWNTVTGRTDNAMANLLNAAENGKKHGAIGFLNTNWGDNGHWQPLSVCYPGYAYGAGLSWAIEKNKDMDLPVLLDSHLYRDQTGSMGKLVYDLGNAYKVPGVEVRNASILFRILLYPDANFNRGIYAKLTKEKLEQTLDYIDKVMVSVEKSSMKISDSKLIKAELICAANILRHGCRLGIAKIDASNKKIDRIPMARRVELANELEGIITEFKRLWLIRNRPGGLPDSVARFEKILKYYKAE